MPIGIALAPVASHIISANGRIDAAHCWVKP
jgi:hypothetical protein